MKTHSFISNNSTVQITPIEFFPSESPRKVLLRVQIQNTGNRRVEFPPSGYWYLETSNGVIKQGSDPENRPRLSTVRIAAGAKLNFLVQFPLAWVDDASYILHLGTPDPDAEYLETWDDLPLR